MWRIYHRLFGWHYIEVEKDCKVFVVRVKMRLGKLFGEVEYHSFSIDKNGDIDSYCIEVWKPLTWKEE